MLKDDAGKGGIFARTSVANMKGKNSDSLNVHDTNAEHDGNLSGLSSSSAIYNSESKLKQDNLGDNLKLKN